MSVTALQPQNLPTPQQEEWKYTNLPRAVPVGLTPAKPKERVIHIFRGQTGAQHVEHVWTGVDKTLHAPVLKVILEEGTELTLIERNEGTGAYWKNATTNISIAKNAKLRHIRINNDSFDAVNTNMVHITVDKDAVYDGFSLNLGAKLTRHDIKAEILGANAECSFNGLNLLNSAQHGDTTILIEHKAPHCRSNQFYRTLLDDKARCVFQGKVFVHKPAQKTDAYQLSNAILLSPEAEMDTKPELEIYADDVKCSHGATTGQLDEEPLFYLRSRGLSEKEARLLLVQAFVDEVVDKLADEAVQNAVRTEAHIWLLKAL